MWEVILAVYLSGVGMLMYRLWWPCNMFMQKTDPQHPVSRYWAVTFIIFLLGFAIGGIFLWQCIVSDSMQEKFCAKYLVTILEKE